MIFNFRKIWIYIVPLILGGHLLFTSCSKIDTLPILELTIETSGGSPVEGVMVGLFDDLEEWSMLENPVQVWKETDNNGQVSFIDLKEQIYYFYADGDSVSNIGTDIKLVEPLKMNERRKLKIIVE